MAAMKVRADRVFGRSCPVWVYEFAPGNLAQGAGGARFGGGELAAFILRPAQDECGDVGRVGDLSGCKG